MKYELIDFAKLSESREIIEAKTPPFMSYFIYLVIIILFIGFMWAWYGEVDIVVKATGVVRPYENVSNVINMVGGKVIKKNYYDGQFIQKGDTLYELDKKTSLIESRYLIDETNNAKNKLHGLRTLYDAIQKNDENGLSGLSNSEYYNRFKKYTLETEQLRIIYEESKQAYDRELELGTKYTTEVKLNTLKSNLEKAHINLNRYKTETLLSITKEINTIKDQFASLKSQYASLNQKTRNNIVIAPISGVIQEMNSFNEEEYLPSGVQVLKIVPEGKEKLKVEISVSNKDISKIRESQKVKYKVLAYNYSDYGVVEGRITHISIDAYMNESGAYYKAEGSIGDTEVYNNDGDVVGRIKPGMICEVSFVETRKKILIVLLEKLNFWKEDLHGYANK